LHNGHVRVDIFYASATPRTKAIVDLVGSLCLLIPVMTAIMVLSWEYVANSWAILEVSRENSGIHFVYGLKTIILIFCGMMILQGISTICHSILFLNGRENRFQDDEMPEVL
jgi:TRAP-type mannitol/chloroaromatic compound transport system permease small subunit